MAVADSGPIVVRSDKLRLGDWLHAEGARVVGVTELSGELVILLDSGSVVHLPLVGEVWWVISRKDRDVVIRSLVEVYRSLAGFS